MPKATIYIRVKNWAKWKALGDEPARWVNDQLEQDTAGIVPDHYVFDEAQQKWVEPDGS